MKRLFRLGKQSVLGTQNSGLTLMETVVAMGLIAVAVLFVLGVIARFLSAQGGTAAQTCAKLLVDEVLDRAAAAGPDYRWGFGPGEFRGTRSLRLPNDQSDTEFHYELRATPLRSDPADQGVLYELEAQAWWWSPDSPTSRVEKGRLSTISSRVVYVEN